MATHTAADVDCRSIPAKCAHVDDRGAIGIRPEPAAATMRRLRWATLRAQEACGEASAMGVIF